MSKKKTVLVVDDEWGPRECLRMILAPHYDVHTASDSEEALGLLANKDFDLVTTDLRRPGLSGIDFLKEVKRIWPNKEVIVITAVASLDNAKAAIKYGASDFISKPFGAQEILSAVEKIFRDLKH
jgi:DNA-binding NtrC family response regulator